MKMAIIIALIVIVITAITFALGKKGTQKTTVHITGQLVVDTLESLGYFKLADTEKLNSLKKEIKEAFDQYKVLTTINSENPPHEPYCRRFYSCDGETLFEIGGVVDYLKDVKPTFEKLGIPLTWSNDYFSEDATEHTIIVNGKKYVAFKGDPNDPLIWGWATKNFVEILNDQLKLHNSEERVYPVLGGNDGWIIFLTKPQYDFIFKHFDEREKPKEVNLWWKENT